MKTVNFVLRLEPDLHRKLKEDARRSGTSLNSICQRILHANYVKASPNVPAISHFVSESLIKKIREVFEASLVGLAIFGSVARREATDESDVDLLLVMEGIKIGRNLYTEWDQELTRVLRNSNRVINPQFLALPKDVGETGSLWFEAALDGVILWEKNAELSTTFENLKALIAQGRVRRDFAHGHPYWIKSDRSTG